MLNKHTPGPWKINNFFITAKHGHRMNSVVADVDRHAWTTSDEIRANCHLIAAAPDLLEALENLEVLLDLIASDESVNSEYQINDFKDIARAAIAKAKGSAPQ